MAKKIECTVYDRTGWDVITLIRDQHNTEDAHKATVIIHPKGRKKQRIFVESEVKPLLDIAKSISAKLYHQTDTIDEFDAEELRIALNNFGISMERNT